MPIGEVTRAQVEGAHRLRLKVAPGPSNPQQVELGPDGRIIRRPDRARLCDGPEGAASDPERNLAQ